MTSWFTRGSAVLLGGPSSGSVLGAGGDDNRVIIIQSQPVRLSQECRGGKDRKGGGSGSGSGSGSGGGGGGTSRWVEMTGGAHLVEMRWTGCKKTWPAVGRWATVAVQYSTGDHPFLQTLSISS
jgi:hypothetical protein